MPICFKLELLHGWGDKNSSHSPVADELQQHRQQPLSWQASPAWAVSGQRPRTFHVLPTQGLTQVQCCAGKRLLIKGEGSSGSSGSMGRAASFPPHKSKGIPATRHPSQPLPDSKLQS